jgi:hypothetical protein
MMRRGERLNPHPTQLLSLREIGLGVNRAGSVLRTGLILTY